MMLFSLIALYLAGLGTSIHLWMTFCAFYNWDRVPNLKNLLKLIFWPYGGIRFLILYPWVYFHNKRTEDEYMEIEMSREQFEQMSQIMNEEILKRSKSASKQVH